MNSSTARRERAGSRLGASALVMALALAGVGCQTSGPAPGAGGGTGQAAPSSRPLTAAEQQMRADEDRFTKTVLGGVAVGAGAGAVAGALLGVLRGDSGKEVRKKALVGAVVGGVAGGIDGYVTAKREQAGNNELRAVQAAAADVRQDNQRIQSFLATSNVVLNEGKARLATLRSDVAAKRISVEQAEAARRHEQQNIDSMNAMLAQAKTRRSEYQQASAKFSATDQSKRDLDAEISRMNQQVAQLETHIADYNKALAVSRA